MTTNNEHIAIGTTVTVDGPKGRQGEVRGVQALEPPLSYLIATPDVAAEWVDAARVAVFDPDAVVDDEAPAGDEAEPGEAAPASAGDEALNAE